MPKNGAENITFFLRTLVVLSENRTYRGTYLVSVTKNNFFFLNTTREI